MKGSIVTFLFLAHASLAQPILYKKIKEIKIQSNIELVSVDRVGGFYTVSDCGIEQFSPEGKQQNKYNPKGCTNTDLLEAWPLMRIYAYQKDKQQFIVFDHNLEIVDFLKIDPSFAVEPKLAAPSSDLKSYWILDTDNSIKKIDLNSKSVSLETDTLTNLRGKFVHMREYQSLLFLLDEQSGIYAINKLGNVVSRIDAPGVKYFSFAGEDLYYLKGNQLHFYDIFTKATYSIEVPIDIKFAVATDERLIFFREGLADIFQFTPKK